MNTNIVAILEFGIQLIIGTQKTKQVNNTIINSKENKKLYKNGKATTS